MLSLLVIPSLCEFVLSLNRHKTPFSPYSANLFKSVTYPSIGVWSILKSPVWMIVPASVVIAKDEASMIEWVMCIHSTFMSPIVYTFLFSTGRKSFLYCFRPCSSNLFESIPRGKGVAYIGNCISLNR